MATQQTHPAAIQLRLGHKRKFATARAIVALMLREMATRYGRSPGGYVWAVLEPFGLILVLALGFSLLFYAPPLGNTFILFYATGFLPFHVYQQTSLMVSRSIDFSIALLQYPAVTWVDAIIARFVLNSLTSVIVMLILIVGILAATDSRTLLDIGPIVLGAVLAAFLGLGIGVLNCALIGLNELWAQVWSILTRPLFLVSGIFFLYEDMPASVQAFLWWNPLVHVIGVFRTGFFPSYVPSDVSIVYVLIVSMITLFMGVVLMSRYHRDILSRR